jgi:hypothetical protein
MPTVLSAWIGDSDARTFGTGGQTASGVECAPAGKPPAALKRVGK